MTKELQLAQVISIPGQEPPDMPEMTQCVGGWQPIPHSLNTLARKKLQGTRNTVFWFVWDKTIRHNNTEDAIPMTQFTNALPDSAKTIQRTIDWLKENSWLEVEEEKGKTSLYRIPDWILNMCAPKESGEESQNKSNPGQNDRTNPGQNDRLHKKKEQKKEIPKPTGPVYTTGSNKKVAVVEGSGSFSIKKAEELPIVKEIIEVGVNRTIIDKAMRKKEEEWVRRIYEEWKEDPGKAHNMNSPVAVLASRLQDYEETWRKGAVKAVGAGKTSDHQKLPEELVAKYQQAIDEISSDEKDPNMVYLEYVSGLVNEVERVVGKRLDFEIVRTYLREPMAVNMVKKALAGEVAL